MQYPRFAESNFSRDITGKGSSNKKWVTTGVEEVSSKKRLFHQTLIAYQSPGVPIIHVTINPETVGRNPSIYSY